MRLAVVALALACLVGITQAQSDSDELIKIKESVKESVSKQMQGWTYRSIEPIQGSRNVGFRLRFITDYGNANDNVVQLPLLND